MAYPKPFLRRPVSIALFAMASVFSVSAFAQWQWIDNTGRKVFSDTAPPPGIPDKNILKQPGAKMPVPAIDPSSDTPRKTDGADAVAKIPNATSSGKDDALEAKKKQADDAEKAKKAEEANRLAKIRAENCTQAKRAKATYESGVRVMSTNAKGEREFLDDAQRAEQVKRLDGIVQSDCSPNAR